MYTEETMLAWLISSKCFPEDVVKLKLLKRAIGPKLTNLISLPFANAELSVFLINSKYKSR